jgi:hypothetical protein
MIRTLTILAALACLAAPARATIVSQHASGFTSSHEVLAPISTEAAYKLFGKVGVWWSSRHTYSGVAANLSLAIKPGGCWCEKLEDGGFVEHMRLVYAAPSVGLRFVGGLGPLQQLAANGAMNVQFIAGRDGKTRIKLDYVVSGLAPETTGAIAKAVDGVLAEQVANYAAAAGAR